MTNCFRKSEVEYEFYSNLRFILLDDDTTSGGRASPFLSIISRSALESITTINIQIQTPAFLLAGLDDQSGYHALHIRNATRDWLRLCELLANAINLQNLQIIIFDRRILYMESLLLQPLQRLHVPSFTVQLPWPHNYYPNRQLASDMDYPFKILRPSLEQMRVFETPPQAPYVCAADLHVNRRRPPFYAILCRCFCCCCIYCCRPWIKHCSMEFTRWNWSACLHLQPVQRKYARTT